MGRFPFDKRKNRLAMKCLWIAGLGLEWDNHNVLDASAASKVSHNRHSLSSETLLGKEVERAWRRGYGPLFEQAFSQDTLALAHLLALLPCQALFVHKTYGSWQWA